MKFVDAPPPPERSTRTGRWAAVLAPLREHPGRWAELDGTFNPGMANHIRSGKVSGAEPGEFEAVVRKVHLDPETGKKGGTLYVRFVGHEDEDEIDAEPEWSEDTKELFKKAIAPDEDENPFADFLPKEA